MATNHADRLQRARWSLEGLATGDAFGERCFYEPQIVHGDTLAIPVTARPLPSGRWEYTDDTQMALSIVEILARHGGIDQDALAQSFAARFEPQRGYGPAMYRLLPQLRMGRDWRTAAAALFDGQGSFGNGAAMRVAPLGAYFADDLPAVVDHAARSAVITHSHPEAIAGAVAVAVAAAVAWQARAAPTVPRGGALLALVLPHIPASLVRERVALVAQLPADADLWDVVRAVGNGSGISAQDTVPFALWCAAQHLDNYEAAIWRTASGSGDIDTNCAIVGGIVASYTGTAGIPAAWLRRREPLPAWAFGES